MSKALIDNFTVEELRELAANSTSIQELSKKLGYTTKGSVSTILDRLNKYNISIEHFTGQGVIKIHRTPENTFIENSTASQATLRRLYRKGNYTPYECAICGLPPFWNNKELTLTLDHINGKNHDDRLENLRWVCPNCDRQLDTFGSKNTNKKIQYNSAEPRYCVDCGKLISYGSVRCTECAGKLNRKAERPSKEELYNTLLNNNGNFTLIGKQYKVSDNAIRRWCDSYNIPRHSADYKKLKNI